MSRFTVYELVHKWANKNFTKEELKTRCYASSYEADNTELKRGTLIFAKHCKNFIAIRNFDLTGTFGNGISSYHVLRSIPIKNKKPIIISDELLTEEIINNEESFKFWYRNHFISGNEDIFSNISVLKEFVNNNRVRRNVAEYISFKRGVPNSFYKKYRHIFNSININVTKSGEIYYGWGYSNRKLCQSVTINKTVKELLRNKNPKYYLTKKEKELYDFKIWHLKYKDIYGFTFKQSQKAYYDEERRKSLELEGEEIIRRRNEISKRKLEEKQKQDNLKHFKRIEDWLKHETDNIGYNYHSYYDNNYQLLRLENDKTYSYIRTSLHVRVTIEEAKRALALFRRYKDTKKPISLENLKIAGFSVKGVENKEIFVYNNGDPKIENHNCLIVGCHKIPYFEIERFLKSNNLNW